MSDILKSLFSEVKKPLDRLNSKPKTLPKLRVIYLVKTAKSESTDLS